MIANLLDDARLLWRAGPAGRFMKALADQVRGYVRGMSDDEAVKFGFDIGIIGVIGPGQTVAADVPPGGGRKKPGRKPVHEVGEAYNRADDVVAHVRANSGQRVGEIAKGTGLSKATVAKILKAERGKRIEQQGERGAARYYPIEAD